MIPTRSSFLPLCGTIAFAASWTPLGLKIDLASVDSGSIHRIRLRTFQEPDSSRWMVALDPDDLRTSVLPVEGWIVRDSVHAETTTWGRLHRDEIDSGWKNSGLTRDLTSPNGMVLSLDLCPSRHPLERHLIRRVWESFGHDGKPAPIAFAISGDWIRTHPGDLAWLVAMADSGRIEPTWINHTDNHYYRKGLAENLNFLFLPGTDVTREILGCETEMLRHGLVPSVFFRFPGLIDNETIFAEVLEAGLLPVGADAWLAKNQRPRPGSIVLVHGNGNEPAGVFDFLRFLDRRRAEIAKGLWRLESLAGEIEAEMEAVRKP
jgi:hypothetical protein